MVYDVTNPRDPVFVQYAFKNDQDATAEPTDDIVPKAWSSFRRS